ncbi:MAG: serine/threonine protein kinase [Blastocatellia bacterium]|nr:serine/threonine protein kinase [Blastocatellia bacterium]
MEYIEGLPLLQYCDEHQLSTNERLDLFKTICSAVQHAHQNLVIHRDLKPNNILVTHQGEVKLLDFGVAKFLNPELVGELNQTQTQFRVMTPEYASPEQIKGTHITTASDIYSLGVILYELLTGERPFKFEGKT